MADVTVGHIIDQAEKVLIDEGNDDFTETELIAWYNLGQRDIVAKKPDAYTVIDSVILASGIRQVLPSGSMAFVDVVRNMGTDGDTPGTTILVVPWISLKVYLPSYSSVTATTEIRNAAPDPVRKDTWYCYPPSDGTGYVEVEYSKAPTQITYDASDNWQSNLIAVDNEYVDAVLNYILWRAWSKDTDIPGSFERSQIYWDRYYQSVGVAPTAPPQQ